MMLHNPLSESNGSSVSNGQQKNPPICVFPFYQKFSKTYSPNGYMDYLRNYNEFIISQKVKTSNDEQSHETPKDSLTLDNIKSHSSKPQLKFGMDAILALDDSKSKKRKLQDTDFEQYQINPMLRHQTPPQLLYSPLNGTYK
jgi:hypothetical protein